MSEAQQKQHQQQQAASQHQNIQKQHQKEAYGPDSKEKQNTRTIYLNDSIRNVQFNYKSNYIRTTKYTKWSYFPLCLFQQFKRFANIYFLMIAVVQSISIISPLNPGTAIAPLCFVVAVSMLREAIEDYIRYRSDKETNSQIVYTLRDGAFKELRSDEIEVGDLCLIREGDMFPADLILLASSNEGICYIQTSSLDGEKNLKKRSRPKGIERYILNTFEPDRILFVGECVSEQPNTELYQYTGKINICGDNFSLNANQLLLKGSSLKNTDWVLGFVLYTGSDTKLMMNSQEVRFKQSKLERKMNRLVFFIVLAQIILCCIIAIVGSFWYRDEDDRAYYLVFEYNVGTNGVISFFSYFLLLNTMLPISLIVTLEVVKVVQAYFIINDVKIFSQERNRHAKVSSTSIIEELGQINYIFSDKTGTLTRNVMEFKLMNVGGVLYGNPGDLEVQKPDEHGLQRQVTSTDTKGGIEYAFKSDQLDQLLAGDKRQNFEQDYHVKSQNGKVSMHFKTQKDLVMEFLKVLTLAHECVPETVSKDDGTKLVFYQGPSPDEVTLVDFAKNQGFYFKETTDTKITVEYSQPGGGVKDIEYPVYRKMEFNSDRKRMSIILRDPVDNLIKMYTKGADSIIKSRLDTQQIDKNLLGETEDFLNKASLKGLRTLLMSMKVIDESEYQEFTKKIAEAEKDVMNRDKILANIYDEFERGLVLLGGTAVEDRLQDNVPETINDLQEAGIKIWMLTGDKLETAENIGYSCKLLKNDMTVWRMSTMEDVQTVCSDERVALNTKMMREEKKRGLLVEAGALNMILANTLYKKNFIKISKSCEAVICCRVSPRQKADVVRLIKEDDDQAVTLAIGDGANDVSMILEAHIGVGLYGNEGMRAVQSGDFALGEFQYLWRLLLVHGRWCYLRNAELILYFFYKNLVFTIPQFFFAYMNGYSGQTVYDDYYITCYNLIFTALPLCAKAVWEQDLNPATDGADIRPYLPKLYYIGQKSTVFNWTNYFIWVFNGICHSVIVFFIPYYVYFKTIIQKSGTNADMWIYSITSFTSVILTVTAKLMMQMRYYCHWNFIAIFLLSVGIYYAFVWIANMVWFSNTYVTVFEMHSSPLFFLTVFLIVGTLFVVDLFVTSYRFNFMTTPTDFLRTMVSQKKKIQEHLKEFNSIYAKIKSFYVNEDIQREQELETKREEMAAMVLRSQQRNDKNASSNVQHNPHHKVKPEAMQA